jgi:Lon protease-like protein
LADTFFIGLFPLRMVLLPGEIVPLHIFEERYKRLIGECRDGGVFGIVLAGDEGAADFGCTAVVHEVLEEFDDGRLNILVEGRDPVRIVVVEQPDDTENGYLRGEVTVLVDDDPADDGSVEGLAETAAVLFRRMAALMGVDEPRVPSGTAPLSFRLAAAVDFGVPLKQRLLESRSEPERLEVLVAVMNTLIPGLELRKQREDAIRGNGKGN